MSWSMFFCWTLFGINLMIKFDEIFLAYNVFFSKENKLFLLN